MIIKKLNIFARKQEVNKAFDESKNDQRAIEETLSGSSGNPTKHEYDGLLTRDSKKRD